MLLYRLFFTSALALFFSAETIAQDVLDYVNPFIGTSDYGATNPGALVPNGMMSVSPFNVMGSELNRFDKDSRWWSAPYDFTNRYFTGFSHVNLSGVGCPELASVLTVPTAGEVVPDYALYGSEYDSETASPGYYALNLLRYGIRAEVTATRRTSIERYSFPGGRGNVLVNLGEGLTNESGAYVRKVSNTEIEGMKLLGTFCYNPQKVFPIYFVIRVSKAPSETGFWKKQRPMKGIEADWTPDNGKYKLYTEYGRDLAGDDIGYYFSFDGLHEGETVEVQVGVSFVSTRNARENLEAEQSGFDFDSVRLAAEAAWREDLSKIKVYGGTREQKRVFYTALYHSLIHPNILNDVNGEYPLMESSGTGRVEDGRDRYTVFSLWDTYRNVHQLLTLVYPHRQLDMVRSMVSIAQEWGWMPRWELYGRETFTMEGDPAIPVITDTWLKGLRDFDVQAAYRAMRRSAVTPGSENALRRDIDPYLEKGYIPLGVYTQDLAGDVSVSHALEYYVADHALSVLADSLGYKDDARMFMEHSLGYKNYYCPEYGTLRPLNPDGTFYGPFDPRQGADFETAPGFHEGSAWNYTFYVPHDIKGLAKLMGGADKFVEKLQMVFDTGLYDPANEPDIAYPYLFSYFKGEEWRTQELVAALVEEHYSDTPGGIPGNDDTGAMSAWAVFSMMGLYPDCPGSPYYVFTTPVFDRIEITLDPDFHGRDCLIIEKDPDTSGKYIDAVYSGGKRFKGFRISHEELLEGGHVVFGLTDEK